jgi:hypothetical protein
MKNISFALTESQFLDGTKDVTRRLGWQTVKPGQRLMACQKCQGLRPGETIVRLGEIEILSVRRETLNCMIVRPRYGKIEAAREGFPHLTGAEFVALFIRHMRVEPTKIITRLEFRRISPANS